MENALISRFFCILLGKMEGYGIFQYWMYSGLQEPSFKLLNVTIGPRASLLQCLYFPIENALWGWKLGQNRGRILNWMNSFLLFGPKRLHKISSKPIKNCNHRSDDGQTCKWFYNCPMLCYINGTDNNTNTTHKDRLLITGLYVYREFTVSHSYAQQFDPLVLGSWDEGMDR